MKEMFIVISLLTSDVNINHEIKIKKDEQKIIPCHGCVFHILLY